MRPSSQFIINFHGIGTPDDCVDASERRYWVDEVFFERLVEQLLARADADQILWTFDDGNRSDITVGARILASHNCVAHFFLLTGRFGDRRYLSVDDARELLAMGMRIGLHGRDHVDWRCISDDQLHAETIEARTVLGDAVNASIDSVAIPFGAYNRKVIAHLKRCGFDAIYTSDGGHSHSSQRIRNRTSVRADMTFEDVNRLLDSHPPLSATLRRRLSTMARRYFV